MGENQSIPNLNQRELLKIEAAQRAYRERKERKMKELEDKVRLLEDANVRALTETDFYELK